MEGSFYPEKEARLPILIKPFTKSEDGYDETLEQLIERMLFLRSRVHKHFYTYYNGVYISTLDQVIEGPLKEVYEKRFNSKKRKIKQIASAKNFNEAKKILLETTKKGYVTAKVNVNDDETRTNQVIFADRMYFDRFAPEELNLVLNYRMLASQAMGSREYYESERVKAKKFEEFMDAVRHSDDQDIDF